MQAAPLDIDTRQINLPERVAFRAPDGTTERLEKVARLRGTTPGQLARHLLLQALKRAQ